MEWEQPQENERDRQMNPCCFSNKRCSHTTALPTHTHPHTHTHTHTEKPRRLQCSKKN